MTGDSATDVANTFSDITPVYVSISGTACLYRALRYGRMHMLKALKPGQDGSRLCEHVLRKEFSIGYRLEHSNICRTLGWEQVDGLGGCIVMEYVDGMTLTDFMARGCLTRELAQKILLELCSALQYLHGKQLVHRDIKPDNILITYNGNNVKLIDFGLSDGDDYCLLKEPAGTRHYLAPEVLKPGHRLDLRADIYSMGVLMGEMAELLCDRRLARISRRCTAQRPEKRYSSAAEVADALKESRRHGLYAYPTAVASVFLILALLAVGGWQGWKALHGAATLLPPPAYGNLSGGETCRKLIRQEQLRLQGQGMPCDRRQLRADSLRLAQEVEAALKREYPLPEQQAEPSYKRLQEMLLHEASLLYSDVSPASSTMQAKRPQVPEER